MKAKEYAARYLETRDGTEESDNVALCAVFNDMTAEHVAMVKSRKIVNDYDVVPIFDELFAKWRAFAVITDCNPDGLRMVFEARNPGFIAQYDAFKRDMQARTRTQRR